MARPCLTVLSDAEIEAIHRNALRLLGKIGMVVPSQEAIDILVAHGGKLTGDRVLLPPELVEEAIEEAPRRFRLADRRGKGLSFPTETHNHVSGSNTLQVLDYKTGKPRDPVWEDVVRFTRLADALPLIAAVSPQVTTVAGLAGEPVDAVVLRILAEVVCNTTKHCMLAPLNKWLGERWIRIGEILAGGQTLASNPVISVIVSPNTPLVWESDSIDTLISAARLGLPVHVASVGMGGMSVPVTVAGSLSLVTAQSLFGLVLCHLINADVPCVWSATGDEIMDMRSMELALAGPEDALGMVAGVQMAKYYRLPSSSAAPHSDSKQLDEQVGMEKMAGILATIAAGAELSINAGSLNKSSMSSYEQMVIDHELLRYALRFLGGITVTQDTLAYDAMAEVGPGGNFLANPHTLRHLRSGENVYFGLFDRTGLHADVASLTARAHEEAERVIASHQPSVPSETIEDIRKYIEVELAR